MKSDITILALDLGRNVGWACSTGQKGVAQFTQLAHGHMGFSFMGWLSDLLVETGAGVVVVERMVSNPRFAGHEGQRVCLGLRMLTLTCCHAHERAVEEVSTATWKAWSKRNMPSWQKGDMQDAVAMLLWWETVRLPKLEAA